MQLFKPVILIFLLLSHESEWDNRNSVSNSCVKTNQKFGEVNDKLPCQLAVQCKEYIAILYIRSDKRPPQIISFENATSGVLFEQEMQKIYFGIHFYFMLLICFYALIIYLTIHTIIYLPCFAINIHEQISLYYSSMVQYSA